MQVPDNKVIEYNKNYDMFCFQNCIYYILRENNINNAEFYINKSLSLVIKRESNERMISLFDKNCYDVLPEYSRNINKYASKDNPHSVFMKNAQDALENKQIIAAVDSYYLPYLPYYKKSHGLHSVIFREYDEKMKRIKVIDNVKPWCFEGYVEIDDFLQARNSSYTDNVGMFSNIPINNMWEEVSLQGWNGKTKDLILRQIELSLKQYYFPQDDSSSFVKGINVFAYIIIYLQSFQTLTIKKQDVLLDGIHKVLYKLNHRRKFWEDFLGKIPGEYQTTLLKEYNENNQLSEKYCEILLYKILMLKAKKKLELVDDICKKFNVLIEMERMCGEKLIRYFNEYR